MNLDMGLILLGAASVLGWGCWRIGREFPSPRRLEEVYGERLQNVYDAGWDESALAHAGQGDELTVVLERGRRAVDDDEPARLPSPILDRPAAMCPLCPHRQNAHYDGRGCAQCNCDMYFVEATPETIFEAVRANEDWYGTMRRELAPEYERPASNTDQFQAVLGKVDGFERQCLLTWDSTRRYDRDRPAWLREMGMSDERIREVLGAETA